MLQVSNLSPVQKAILRSLVLEIATLDNDVTFSESEFVKLLFTSLASDENVAGSAVEMVKDHFTTTHEKFCLVATLFVAALIDNISHPLELKFIQEVIQNIHLDPEWVSRVYLWAQREAIQFQESLLLIAVEE